MTVGPFLQFALDAVDVWAAVVPRKRPSPQALKACKIISHRGEHDNETLLENTMEAFRVARDAGAWGIETDIRWTKDLVPMIHHDTNTARVFGKDIEISECTFADLRDWVPAIPTLTELVAEFGGNTHLMIEIKEEEFPQLGQQREILFSQLSKLAPKKDYHFLALDPDLFERFDIQPRDCCLPVALTNMKALSEAALNMGYGGITGHFLLLTKNLQARHRERGQGIGPGFPRSRNSLYREINRGADWIFTNDAVKLLKVIDEA